MAKTDVTVPDLGDYQNVPVIEILVKEGDRVDKDAALITLESEKATMEVPAPAAGVVRGITVKVGDKVSQGDVIMALEGGEAFAAAPEEPRPATAAKAAEAQGEGRKDRAPKGTPIATLELATGEAPQPASGKPRPAPDVGPKEEQQPPPRPQPPTAEAPWVTQARTEIPHASPFVRKLAREFGVDLAKVQGSGPKGRIVADDVKGYTKQALAGAAPAAGGAGIPQIPTVDFAQFGEIETRPLARIRKLSAQHVRRSWLNVPHVTQNDEADITDLESFRKSQSEEAGVKLTLLPFVMKAVSISLKAYPEFNASLGADGASLVLKKYCNIGFAADTEHGLVVPVVKDVWSKGVVQLAVECAELAKKAREAKLKPDEMKGGCFSISSLGGIGGAHFTPIVNAPEVGILGVSRAAMKPQWTGTEFVPRLMCPLSLSYDHRVIDGAYAARFVVHLAKQLSDLRRALL